MTLWTGVQYLEGVTVDGAKEIEAHFTGVLRGKRTGVVMLAMGDFSKTIQEEFGVKPNLRHVNARFEADEWTPSGVPLEADYVIITHRGREHYGKYIHHKVL